MEDIKMWHFQFLGYQNQDRRDSWILWGVQIRLGQRQINSWTRN